MDGWFERSGVAGQVSKSRQIQDVERRNVSRIYAEVKNVFVMGNVVEKMVG